MRKQQLKQDIETLYEYIEHIKSTVNDLLWENYPNGEPTTDRETLTKVMELLDPGISPYLTAVLYRVKKMIREVRNA